MGSKKRLGPATLVAGAVTVGLVLSGALAAGPASAKTTSFTNPLATAATTDLDITSLDVDYGVSRAQVTLHVQNLDYSEYELFLGFSKTATFDDGSPSDLAINVETEPGELAYSALTFDSEGNAVPLSPSSVVLTQNKAAGTVTVSAASSLIPETQVYVAAEVAGEDKTVVAATSLSGDGSPIGFGPIRQDVAVKPATKTTTKLAVSKKTQTYGKKAAKLTVKVSPAAAGKVVVYDGKKKLKTLKLKKGKAHYTLSKKLKKGTHKLKAKFVPAKPAAFAASTSKTVKLKVIKH